MKGRCFGLSICGLGFVGNGEGDLDGEGLHYGEEGCDVEGDGG